MQKILYPPVSMWPGLTMRPAIPSVSLDAVVQQVFDDVRAGGDEAFLKYTGIFDKVKPATIRVSDEETRCAAEMLSDDLRAAIALAAENIQRFHETQRENVRVTETVKGVRCWRESRPVERVGLYVPGGTAPLFSTVLMLAIPARIAGCSEIVLCTPPGTGGKVNPAILYAASLAGVTSVFAAGGIQAVAAMAFGTETMPKVMKIFGPGNQYVTAAKQRALEYGVAIDMPAGPSEVLVITDSTGNPDYIAADLLSQAEHGPDSQVMLLSADSTIVDQVLSSVERQLTLLPREETARRALDNSRALVMKTTGDCISFSNMYAPEHLVMAMDNASDFVSMITSAGSVFLGHHSCESAGDYATGTNHTLPTNGYACSYSGVSVDSFVKKITFQELTGEGLNTIGPSVVTMAEAEGLRGHANSITIRLNK